jgi:hypothetical protein
MRFALWSGASALTGLLLLLPVALPRDGVVLGWGLTGWLLTAAFGVAGGAWAVSRHGRPGNGFLMALGVCMLARLFLFVAGPLAASPLGMEAVWALLAGLFAGYLPSQAAEVIWFARATQRA